MRPISRIASEDSNPGSWAVITLTQERGCSECKIKEHSSHGTFPKMSFLLRHRSSCFSFSQQSNHLTLVRLTVLPVSSQDSNLKVLTTRPDTQKAPHICWLSICLMFNPQGISLPGRWSLWCPVLPYIGPGPHFFCYTDMAVLSLRWKENLYVAQNILPYEQTHAVPDKEPPFPAWEMPASFCLAITWLFCMGWICVSHMGGEWTVLLGFYTSHKRVR